MRQIGFIINAFLLTFNLLYFTLRPGTDRAAIWPLSACACAEPIEQLARIGHPHCWAVYRLLGESSRDRSPVLCRIIRRCSNTALLPSCHNSSNIWKSSPAGVFFFIAWSFLRADRCIFLRGEAVFIYTE